MRHTFQALTLLAATFLATATQAQDNTLSPEEATNGWKLLFDGKTLDGWTTSADLAAWTVDNGTISVVKPGKGWWLRTTRMYRDFEMTVDFDIAKGANSGVGLRGSSMGDPAFTGMEIQVFGNQGEKPTITSCGAVYDAIQPQLPKPEDTLPLKDGGQWNSYRITLIGDTLNIWLNGVQIHKDQHLDTRGYVHKPDAKSPLKDRLPTGYISFQDHGDKVRFRNVKIHDLSPDKDPSDFQPIFNNKDTAGWTTTGAGSWKSEDGVLVGRDGPGHLMTDATWKDIELRAFVKISDKGNSGIYFRGNARDDKNNPWPLGFEAQIDNHDPKNFTGCIYNLAWPAAKTPTTRDEAWFDYRIRAEGDHIQTWINGQPMTQAHLADFKDGHVALQTHNPGNVVMFKDVQVRTVATK